MDDWRGSVVDRKYLGREFHYDASGSGVKLEARSDALCCNIESLMLCSRSQNGHCLNRSSLSCPAMTMRSRPRAFVL